jgi:hypothetical protein
VGVAGQKSAIEDARLLIESGANDEIVGDPILKAVSVRIAAFPPDRACADTGRNSGAAVAWERA